MKVTVIGFKSISREALRPGLEKYLPNNTSYIVTPGCSSLALLVSEYADFKGISANCPYVGVDRDTPSNRRSVENMLDGAKLLVCFTADGATPGFRLPYAIQIAKSKKIMTHVYNLKIEKKKKKKKKPSSDDSKRNF